MPDNRPAVVLPSLPSPTPLDSAVLFGFDDRAFPFVHGARVHLAAGQRAQLVVRPGPEGSHDEVILYYGTVIKIGDVLHLWYIGNYGPLQNTVNYERVNCCICYATSRDGVTWEKPDLGLVEFNGSRKNNIVQIDAPKLWSTCAVLHEPDDPDPARRYKLAYEAVLDGRIRFCVAFSPDGLRWTPSPRNPVGPFLEMSGVAKWRGLYYVNGQADLKGHQPTLVRRLATFASADFEHWSPCSAVGLDRGPTLFGPAAEDHAHQYEEIHLGAALWNRESVLLGLYGMWHGHPSGDRALVVMDLGLALSHDAIHFHEPIPGFRIVPAREQPERPLGVLPSLMQGQGMENVGDRTLYWYSLWRGTGGSGVRVISWGRDRLGYVKPFRTDSPMIISCPARVEGGPMRAFANVSGVGEHSRLRIGLVDEGFRAIPGYSVEDAEPIHADTLKQPLRWRGGDAVSPALKTVRFDVRFEGVRVEDGRLHAVYLER